MDLPLLKNDITQFLGRWYFHLYCSDRRFFENRIRWR